MSIYQEHGYKDREDYFNKLSIAYNIDIDSIYNIANLLGEKEDFDGLIYQLNNSPSCLDYMEDDFYDRCLG